jgi:hypothetical protein
MKKLLLTLFAILLLIAAFNLGTVGYPIRSAVRSDDRNKPVSISAHYAYYLLPNTLVLRMSATGEAAAVDIWRSMFLAAESMYNNGKHFSDVELSRGLTTEYILSGNDFFEIGREYKESENPIYMLRTLPEKLKGRDGSDAFGPSSGSLFGMADDLGNSTKAAMTWARGAQ